jgi:uncharacterized heparinase superfamily protein
MSGSGPSVWLRDARRAFARLPNLRLGRVPDAPAHPVRDPWPGDPARGARLLKGEILVDGAPYTLHQNGWGDTAAPPELRTAAHSFSWLRDLRALGTDAARLRARALVGGWIAAAPLDPLAPRPDIAGARLTAWLAHYDFFAASADDHYRQRLMTRIVADARALSAVLPAEQIDARALTALKGLIAAAVALPDNVAFLTRAQRFLPPELARQVLADGTHCERSPRTQLSALQDLVEIRALLQAAQATPPIALNTAIERMALALRVMRHGDGGLVVFNGSREQQATLVDIVLAQASRTGRPPASLPDGRFQRLQAGKTMVLIDAGAPPPPGLDRYAHAGTLAFEMSIGRERLIVNCGEAPPSATEWRDAMRATAAHSTLVIADTSSAELKPEGLGRRPEKVVLHRQEANGAHWMETSHDGWRKPFRAIHHRRLYLAETGEDMRGEDSIQIEGDDPEAGLAYTVRFHLHPGVDASLQQDGEAVLLRLPSGAGWRLRAEGAHVALEESVYLGGETLRKSEQVVLIGHADGPQHVKWAITKVA